MRDSYSIGEDYLAKMKYTLTKERNFGNVVYNSE